MNIVLHGAAGRMGQVLLESVEDANDLQLVACVDSSGVEGCLPDLAAVEGEVNAVIDFTLPDGAMRAVDICEKRGWPLVTGTTGFSDAHRERIEGAATVIPIVAAPNMSIGVNLVFKLLNEIIRVLGLEAEVDIQEKHHIHKVDAPSGTALKMGELIASARGQKLDEVAVFEAAPGTHEKGTIGFVSLREGESVGVHTANFAMEGENISITHEAFSRHIYAIGALRAARWIQGKLPGLYGMPDVLGL